MYFWKNAFGRPMKWLQSRIQKSKFVKTKLRTETSLDFVTSYIAYSSFRHMFMKPLLLIYIIMHIFLRLCFRHAYISICIVMLCVLVFPKIATCNRENYKHIVIETVVSVLQFTPEAVVGSVRICRALYANLSLNAKWISQKAVEEEFKNSNPFVSSFKQLWGYSLFSILAMTYILCTREGEYLAVFMLMTILILPVFTGFTSLSVTSLGCNRRAVDVPDIPPTLSNDCIVSISLESNKKKRLWKLRRLVLRLNKLKYALPYIIYVMKQASHLHVQSTTDSAT